ncbi:MAG: hypothetical protein JW836_09470 [Deltaproteobacteria bacterium]|nr:hypothetical protein [Deltaproteobacteria bacterium]
MAKKKKRKKLEPSSPLLPEEALLMKRFLEELEPQGLAKRVSVIPTDAVAERLVENLPLDERRTPEILVAIGKAFPHKTVRKAVKKKLFKLKQKGIPSLDREPESSPAFLLTTEESTAFVGPIDGAGNRPVLLTIPQVPAGVDLAMGVINDEKGVIEFIYGRYSRKKMKELKDVFFSKVPHMVETTLSHIATVLEKSYCREKDNPGDPASEYLRLRPWLLKNARLLDRPALSDLIPLSAVAPNMPGETQIQKLLNHELIASWVIDPEKLGTLIENIERARESPIFISEAQRGEHIIKIKEEGIAKIFGGKDCEILRERLQETAYLFFKIGEESLARLCLAASLSLDEKTSLLGVNPFLKALVDRSLALLRKPARSSPLILR